ncbi:MAG TPA: hypothetical protein VFY29_00235, partial [Terriglobia bacterium]|nr:hypothetical protein [Terriglobia bacterium]
MDSLMLRSHHRPESSTVMDDAFDIHPFSYADYVYTLFDHKGVILVLTALGVLVSLGIWSVAPRMYRAEASLEMRVMNEDFLDLRDVRTLAAPSLFSVAAEDSQINTQVGILQQDWLINRTLQRLQQE